MNLTDIKNMPVMDIAADDCVLLMWCTNNGIPQALEVISSWGFEFKTVAFTWVKRNKRTWTSWFWGMGYWTRQNSELCLLATRGKPKRVSKGVHSIIESPVEAHSKKPEIVRDKIIELMGDIPSVELFARPNFDMTKFPNWEFLGNEISGNDILVDIEALRQK